MTFYYFIPAWFASALMFFFATAPAMAVTEFRLEPGRTVYGSLRQVRIFSNTTLLDIARENDLGFNQITAANPGVDPWVPHDGALVTIPGAVIVPGHHPPEGIVINLAEMRLYLFTSPDNCNGRFYTCPVGTGRTGFSTKPGIYTIYQKKKDPAWVPPPSVRREDPDIPAIVPPGPDNPLGRYVLRFSRESYGIHGTNRPWGIGRRVSHGCIRLYNSDIEELFGMVDVGTVVVVRYEPVKAGIADNRCWLQVCEDYERKVPDMMAEVFEHLSWCKEEFYRQGVLDVEFDMARIRRVMQEKRCIPVAVGVASGSTVEFEGREAASAAEVDERSHHPE